MIFLIGVFSWVFSFNYDGTDYNSIIVDETTRYYVFYIPPSLRIQNSTTKKVPLFLALHGGSGNSFGFRNKLPFDLVAKDHDFLVAFPEGTCSYGEHKRCNWNSGHGKLCTSGIDDVKFLDSVISQLEKNAGLWNFSVGVDPNAVVIVGHSNGGFMTYTLATNSTFPLQAIVPISGTIGGISATPTGNKHYNPPDPPQRPMNVVHFHGILDESVRIEGGETGAPNDRIDLPMNYSMNFWLKTNKCNPPQIDDNYIVVDNDRQGEFFRIRYTQDCSGTGKKIRSILMPNVGHPTSGMCEKFDKTHAEKGGFTELATSYPDLIWRAVQEVI